VFVYPIIPIKKKKTPPLDTIKGHRHSLLLERKDWNISLLYSLSYPKKHVDWTLLMTKLGVNGS
jgi:hypothetical protein